MDRRIGLQQKLLATVDRYDMLADGQQVLVAVSGGPDSMALLHALQSLSRDLGVRPAVAHLNHQLRGAAADEDEGYVRRYCERHHLACFVERRDVAALATAEKLSVEEGGRRARYEFFARLATAEGFDCVALGHTATDRIETLLINLLRGAGLHGLRSIPPRRSRFIRPLITVHRHETAQYCTTYNLQPRVDTSNLSAEHHLRNRVRLELLPLLGRDYAPHIDTSLLRLAQAVEQELEWTEPLVATAYGHCAQTEESGVRLDLSQLADMAEGLRYRVLRKACCELGGQAVDMATVHYEALHRLVRSDHTGAKVTLPGGILGERGYNSIRLRASCLPDNGPVRPLTGRRALLVPGVVTVPELNLTLAAEFLQQCPDELGHANGRQVVVDADATGDELFIRTRRPGDRFQPLGMSGHKKVHDIFVDERVPRRERPRVPLIMTGRDEIIWLVGYRLAEPFKITADTRRHLKLTAHWDQAASRSENRMIDR